MEGEEKEIKLWYRDLLNADGRTIHLIRPLPPASASLALFARGPGTCNQRVLANDSNQFVVFPSRERTKRQNGRTNGGYEL